MEIVFEDPAGNDLHSITVGDFVNGWKLFGIKCIEIRGRGECGTFAHACRMARQRHSRTMVWV